jgi:hypothetical protein
MGRSWMYAVSGSILGTKSDSRRQTLGYEDYWGLEMKVCSLDNFTNVSEELADFIFSVEKWLKNKRHRSSSGVIGRLLFIGGYT